MIVEMIDSLLICGPGQRFPNVMKQNRQTQRLILLHKGQRMQNMFSHGPAVMRMILRRLHAGVKFRKNHSRNPRLPQNPKCLRMGGGKKLDQLSLNPFRADFGQTGREFGEGRLRLFLYGKIQLGGKAHCP